jgi:hypothetical protein
MRAFITWSGACAPMVALGLVSCSDPVTSGQIANLPGENPIIPVGEFHRAGQPCVLCHGPNGPASDSPFAVAGTIFTQPNTAVGLGGVTVAMTDASGSSFTVQTNCVGNFWVPRPGTGDGSATWDPEFPIFARIFTSDGVSRTMQGQIGRERSCNTCHNDPNPQSPQYAEQQLELAGHLYFYLATDTPPPTPSGCPVSPVLQ